MFKKLFYGAAVIILVVVAVGIGKISNTFVSAHTSSNDWTSGNDLIWAPDNYTPIFSKVGDYYFTDTTNLRWDSTSANDIKTSGHRYTQDNTDGTSCSTEHFSATGNWGTNFPNPVYDRDNDTWYCNLTWEEAEITANDANFPRTDIGYYVTMQWTRSSNGTGEMYYTSQMSDYDWIFGEWNTIHYDLLYTHNYSYSGAMNVLNKFLAILEKNISSASAHDADEQVNGGELNIEASQPINSKADLEAYKNSAVIGVNKLKAANIEKVKTIITFNTPQNAKDFAAFVNSNKIAVNSFEMRATDINGDKITIGGVPVNEIIDPVVVFDGVKKSPALKNLNGLTLNGVTSFEGIINSADYEKLSYYPSVYFVDATPEITVFDMMAAGKIDSATMADVNVNDLYWYHEDYDR